MRPAGPGQPTEKGERVKIFNQMTESHQVGELAKKVAALTGAKVNNLPNPQRGGRKRSDRGQPLLPELASTPQPSMTVC